MAPPGRRPAPRTHSRAWPERVGRLPRRLAAGAADVAVSVAASVRSGPQPSPTAFADSTARVRRLLDDVVAFWSPRCVDPGGGYRYNHDTDGAFLGPHDRTPLAEARFVHFFSKLASLDGEAEHLAVARHGFDFLCDLADDDGGFPTVVTADGAVSVGARDLATHAFVLSGVAAYAAASGDPVAAETTIRVFDRIERGFHDESNGGYVELRRPDWSAAQSPQPGTFGRPGTKSPDVQNHVLEALVETSRVIVDPRIVPRIDEMRRVLVGPALARSGTPLRRVSDDWRPLYEPTWRESVVYGVGAEIVSAVLDADEIVGTAADRALPVTTRIFDASLRWGLDPRHGGVFASGPPRGPAWDRRKEFWVQAETLLAAAKLRAHADWAPAERAYLSVLGFVEDHLVDPVAGEWFPWATVGDRPTDPKATRWKTPYHTGRCLIGCLEALRRRRDPI